MALSSAALDNARRQRRRTHERNALAKALFALSIIVVVMSVIAPHRQSVWVMVAGILAAVYYGTVVREGVAQPASEGHCHKPPVASRSATVALVYLVAGVTGIGATFADWRTMSDRTWNGFDDGGGWPAMTAGAILVGLAVLMLTDTKASRWAKSSWPDGIACVCGTALIIAALSRTGHRGMYTGRTLALLAGLMVCGASMITFASWKGDRILRQGMTAGVIGLASTVVIAGSWMSWGGRVFAHHYVPGTSRGGFDGTYSLLAGLSILIASSDALLNGRFGGKLSNRNYLILVSVLGVIAGTAALNGGSSINAHPGQWLTGIAAAFLIFISIARLVEMSEETDATLVEPKDLRA